MTGGVHTSTYSQSLLSKGGGFRRHNNRQRHHLHHPIFTTVSAGAAAGPSADLPPSCPCALQLCLFCASLGEHTSFSRGTRALYTQGRGARVDPSASRYVGGRSAWLAATARPANYLSLFPWAKAFVFFRCGARSQVIRRVHWKKQQHTAAIFGALHSRIKCFFSYVPCLLPLRELSVSVIPLYFPAVDRFVRPSRARTSTTSELHRLPALQLRERDGSAQRLQARCQREQRQRGRRRRGWCARESPWARQIQASLFRRKMKIEML